MRHQSIQNYLSIYTTTHTHLQLHVVRGAVRVAGATAVGEEDIEEAAAPGGGDAVAPQFRPLLRYCWLGACVSE